MQRVLALIKPHVVKSGDADSLTEKLRSGGFTIVARELLTLPQERAAELLTADEARPHYASLLAQLTSGPSIVLVLQREQALNTLRNLAGPADPEKARNEQPDTLRARYGVDSSLNALYISESLAEARRDIALFFPELDVSTLTSSALALEVRSYLDSKIVPVLTSALTQMCQEAPRDPFLWLSDWLLANNPLNATRGGKGNVWSDVTVARLSVGEYFGEIALITNKPRQVSVRADGSVSLLYLDRDAFNRVCGSLMNILSRNMATYNSHAKRAELPLSDASSAAPTADAATDAETAEGSEAQAAEVEDEPHPDASLPALPMEGFKPARGKGKKPAPKRRTVIFVAPIDPNEIFTAKVVPKEEHERQRIREILCASSLFSHLSTDDMQVCIDAMEEHCNSAGEFIIVQGDEGDYFYIIESGRAECYVTVGSAAPKLVKEYAAGDSFGELALLHGDPRAASVKAAEPMRLWKMDRETFRRIMMASSFKKQQSHLGFVSKVPLFESMTKYELMRISESLQSAEYSHGQEIIREGEEGDRFYIVEKGGVVCSKKTLIT